MDLKLRYQKRKAKQEELAHKYQWDLNVIHLASGAQSVVTIELGAQLIVDGSHREATAEEVVVHQEKQRREAERIGAQGRQLKAMNRQRSEEDPNRRVYEFV